MFTNGKPVWGKVIAAALKTGPRQIPTRLKAEQNPTPSTTLDVCDDGRMCDTLREGGMLPMGKRSVGIGSAESWMETDAKNEPRGGNGRRWPVLKVRWRSKRLLGQL